MSFGFIGFVDDYLKLKNFSFKGLPGKVKLSLQCVVTLIFCYLLLVLSEQSNTQLLFPVFKNLLRFRLFLVYFWNASNSWFIKLCKFNRWLDGLAIVPIMIVLSTFPIISYLVGNAIYSNYLNLIYINRVSEIAVFCSAFVGARADFYGLIPQRYLWEILVHYQLERPLGQ